MCNSYQLTEYRESVLVALRECRLDLDVDDAIRFEWTVSLRTTQTITDDSPQSPMVETEVAYSVVGYSDYDTGPVVDERTRFRSMSPHDVASAIAGQYLAVYGFTRDAMARRLWDTLLDAEYPDDTLVHYHYGDKSIYTAVAEIFVDTVSQDDVLWVIHEYGETLLDPLRDELIVVYEDRYDD